jgi:hypothetical protein
MGEGKFVGQVLEESSAWQPDGGDVQASQNLTSRRPAFLQSVAIGAH